MTRARGTYRFGIDVPRGIGRSSKSRSATRCRSALRKTMTALTTLTARRGWGGFERRVCSSSSLDLTERLFSVLLGCHEHAYVQCHESSRSHNCSRPHSCLRKLESGHRTSANTVRRCRGFGRHDIRASRRKLSRSRGAIPAAAHVWRRSEHHRRQHLVVQGEGRDDWLVAKRRRLEDDDGGDEPAHSLRVGSGIAC